MAVTIVLLILQQNTPPKPCASACMNPLSLQLHFMCLLTCTYARLLPASMLCVRGREGRRVRWGGIYLALDDVIILVDLQVVAGVAGDGAAVPVVEVAPGAAASELCIADQRLLAVDGFARVVHTAMGGQAWMACWRKKGIEVGNVGCV